MASREEEGQLVAGAHRAVTTPVPLAHGAVGTQERLELASFFTSLFPELEAGGGAASQLAGLPFLPQSTLFLLLATDMGSVNKTQTHRHIDTRRD